MDGAELRLHHGADGGIVEAHHRQILRQAEPQTPGGFHDAGGQHIVKGEYGGGPIRAAQQTEGRLCGALDIPVAHQRAGFIHRKAVFPHNGEKRIVAGIDSGEQTIVGTNKYRLEKEDPIDILEVDNTAVRQEQIENLRRLKEGRNQAEVDKALEAITECVRTGKGNLLELAVEAARVRATLGEISDACEKIVGRYKAVIRTISGVYSSESKKDADFARACELTEEFAKKEGRRPRIMIAKMGQDGHDRGAKVVATGFADCGFDVDMGPLFQTPEEAAREAVENDVHAVGVSSLAAGHKTLIPQIIDELKKLGREDILVFAGGVIPAQDYDFLYKTGVVAIFGPGTSVAKSACQIMELLLDTEE